MDGGSVVINNLARMFALRGHEVIQFALRSPKQATNTSGGPASAFGMVLAQIDTRPTYAGALWNLIASRRPYHVSRHWSARVAHDLVAHLATNSYDAILIGSIYLRPYLDVVKTAAPGTPVIMHTQNLEHQIWKGLAQRSTGARRWFLQVQAARIEEYEQRNYGAFDAILPVTEVDAAWIRKVAPTSKVDVVPLGITGPSDERLPQARDFFHLGAMDWLPNQDGIRWFLREVWPRFHRRHPEIELHLAGVGMPEDILALNSGRLRVRGTIADPQGFMRERGIMVVPLRVASGIRVKIIEGMAAGKAIISTTTGAAGLDVEHDRDILLADDAEAFAAQMERCIVEPDLVERIGTNAKERIRERYADTAVSLNLERIFMKLTSRSRAAGPH